MKLFLFSIMILIYTLENTVDCGIIKPDLNIRSVDNLIRTRRYLGLNKRFKLNRRYQECLGPGDTEGHCKHFIFCPMDVMSTSAYSLDYLCVIEKSHIGICCPDDIVLPKLQGSQVIKDLPASGTDYDAEDQYTGCGLTSLARFNTVNQNSNSTQRWPWIAALYRPDVPYEQFCGGVLITERHILTAAHCFIGSEPANVEVRLGEYDFTKRNETRSRNFKVKTIKIHEEYNAATYENDIAILKLESPTSFNTYIWPICLPPVEIAFENQTAIVAGWGRIFWNGPTSELLLEVSVPVWPQTKCVASLAQRITSTSFCAAGYDGNKDSCSGDSGGPLVYQLENDRWVVIGIVSWGVGCGNKDFPGVYTRVNKFIPWILSNTLVQ